MVTSQMIFERLMDYRGSKSAICESIVVKEQRVEGSQHISLTKFKMMCLRCTLMGSERNYQAKNLSKQILQIRQLSSSRSLAIFSHTLALQSPDANLPKLFSSLKP
jgi:hypothetical protein